MSNTLNPRMTAWDVTWNAYGLGTLNKVNPGIKLITKPITRGTLGGKNVVIDEFVVGMESKPEIMIPDISAALILELCPWISASQFMSPSTPNTGLYQYAQLLTLHPHDMLTATTEDLNAVKAVPVDLLENAERTGDDESSWKLTFKVFPVLAKLQLATPELVYWFLGPVPGSY